ncbi:hypothetical protein Phum_PHUM581510 [Pediculus humanus corporis]|uniref:Uncharacterized protein n=1 Tax=Pediculus humanus subsp. corporis TaxID=121224 RepID=E0W1P0_PEDHC|nr:uncharacterized protein Phum_PHUM581510 [Pediculus humanus corporis]EEB19622.1 hypothetical protein Phum_PHUM581510 [Pediculus humanus corporis]
MQTGGNTGNKNILKSVRPPANAQSTETIDESKLIEMEKYIVSESKDYAMIR